MADMERPGTWAAGQRGDIRASDAEREKTVTLLQQHLMDGRITAEEFSERTDQIYESRTRGVLEEVLRDLPPIVPPAAEPESVSKDRSDEHHRRRGPGAAKIAAVTFAVIMLFQFLIFVFMADGGPPGPGPGPGPGGDWDGPPFPFPFFPLLPLLFIWIAVRAGSRRSGSRR